MDDKELKQGTQTDSDKKTGQAVPALSVLPGADLSYIDNTADMSATDNSETETEPASPVIPRSKPAGRGKGHNAKLISFTDAQLLWLLDKKNAKTPETLIKQEFVILHPEIAALYTHANGKIKHLLYKRVMQAIHAGIMTADGRLKRIKRITQAQKRAELSVAGSGDTQQGSISEQTGTYNALDGQQTDTDGLIDDKAGKITSYNGKQAADSKGQNGYTAMAKGAEIVGSLSDIDGYAGRGIRNLKEVEILITKAINSLKTKEKYTTKDLKSLAEVKAIQQDKLKDLLNKGKTEAAAVTKAELIQEAITLYEVIKQSLTKKALINKGISNLTSHNGHYVNYDTPMGIEPPPGSLLVDPSLIVSGNCTEKVGQA